MKSYRKYFEYKGVEVKITVTLNDNHCGNIVSVGFKLPYAEKCYYADWIKPENLTSVINHQTEFIKKDIDKLPTPTQEEADLLSMGFQVLEEAVWF